MLFSEDDFRLLAAPIDSREALAAFEGLASKHDDPARPHNTWSRRLTRTASDAIWLQVGRQRNNRLHRGFELEDYVASLKDDA